MALTKTGIGELGLKTHMPDELRAFYVDVLSLPLKEETSDSFGVQAGTTELTFTLADAELESPFYHFAFNIPENKLDAARQWLSKRTALLKPDGNEVVDFPAWNAHAVYFCDPAGNIVEFIARHDLKNAAGGPFTAEDLLCASEIGLVVDDVTSTVGTLTSQLGLEPYRSGSDDFTAMGDEHGLLIVVKRSRPWFPTTDRQAGVFPTTVTLHGPTAARCNPRDYPYELAVTP